MATQLKAKRADLFGSAKFEKAVKAAKKLSATDLILPGKDGKLPESSAMALWEVGQLFGKFYGPINEENGTATVYDIVENVLEDGSKTVGAWVFAYTVNEDGAMLSAPSLLAHDKQAYSAARRAIKLAQNQFADILKVARDQRKAAIAARKAVKEKEKKAKERQAARDAAKEQKRVAAEKAAALKAKRDAKNAKTAPKTVKKNHKKTAA